jgi:hypothetical protein
MKIYLLKIILLAFGTVLVTSCTNKLYTSLDVLRPAKVAFAIDANNLLIINNTVTQPENYGHMNEFLNEKITNFVIPTDSLSIFCLGALTEDLESKNFFNSVQLLPNSINTNKEFFNSIELNDDIVKKLCLTNQADVILSLDKIKENDDLSEFYMFENGGSQFVLEVIFETSWSIHYLNNPEVTQVQYIDTIYWQTESFNRKQAINDLPNRKDELIDGALDTGHKSVNRFVPYWEKVDRFFFNPNNKLMKQGMDSVYIKNWKSAINIWENVFNTSKNARIQAESANNIAIAYEITGNIEKALDYATKSYYSFGKLPIVDYNSFAQITDYINELNKRKTEISILKKQVGE